MLGGHVSYRGEKFISSRLNAGRGTLYPADIAFSAGYHKGTRKRKWAVNSMSRRQRYEP